MVEDSGTNGGELGKVGDTYHSLPSGWYYTTQVCKLHQLVPMTATNWYYCPCCGGIVKIKR